MSLPRELNYSGIMPQGFPSHVYTTEFRPQPFFEGIDAVDNIRFVINRDSGFWDPYSAYFEVDLDFSEADNGT